MGYTHYYTQKRRFSNADWATVITDLTTILSHVMKDITYSVTDGKEAELTFNGLGENAHETFVLTQERPPLESWQEPDRRGWGFCKTARKPYDLGVTACLIYLESAWPKHVSCGSDGRVADWEAGLKLAMEALPRYHNVLQIPVEIRFAELWGKNLMQGNRYSIMVRKEDELVCIVDDKQRLVLCQLPASERQRIEKIEEGLPRYNIPMSKFYKIRDTKIRTILQAAPTWGGLCRVGP